MTTLRDFRILPRPFVLRSFRRSLVCLFTLLFVVGYLDKGNATFAQRAGVVITEPSRDYAPRIVVPLGGTRDVSFDGVVSSVTIIDPEFVVASLLSGTIVRFTALREGETIVIVTGRNLQRTYALEVRPRPAETAEVLAALAARRQRELFRPAGIYTLSFSPSFGHAPGLLRQTLEYTRKTTTGRTLRFSADTFKFIGNGPRGLVSQNEPTFGLNRLTLGLDTPDSKLDVLDSELNLSPITFNGYTMRGLHFSSNPDSRLRGLEFFAGIARPFISFFDKNEGYLGGGIIPVARGKSWRLRAGLLGSVSRGDGRNRESGIVWHADGTYSPSDRTLVAGEVNVAHGALSWHGRFDLRRGPFNIAGESLRLDSRMPLVSLGGQSEGRKHNALSINWQPSARFSAFGSYSRAANVVVRETGRATLNFSNLFASAGYNLTTNSRLNFRYSQQDLETAAYALPEALRLDTRSASLAHTLRFGKRWSNDFEIGLTATRESQGTVFERGWNLHEELRHTGNRWLAAAYFNYVRHTPSFASLIVRNPDLLPPALRTAFEADPVRFLTLNRDLIPGLLSGVVLPETRDTNIGLRLQGAFSRYTLSSELRYSSGEILAREQRNLLAVISANVRLDAANSIQVSAARSFALNSAMGQSALTISYIHRFGGGSEGFRFSRLFRGGRGRIAGRVFLDLNNDGIDDPEEPGLAGMKVQLDGDRSVTSDEGGRFQFSSLNAHEYEVALITSGLGVRLRASTSTAEKVSLRSGQTVSVNFGLNNFGSISGRVFNDLFLTGKQTAGNTPGVAGVRIRLQTTVGPPVNVTVNSSGVYQFRNLVPGNYVLEIDPASVPADFRMPVQTSWIIALPALQNVHQDIPLSAQRAVSGVVFIDKDGNEKFDPEKDEPVAGARVIAGQIESTTNAAGAYIVRGLPAGRIELRAQAPWGVGSGSNIIELHAEPAALQGVGLIIKR